MAHIIRPVAEFPRPKPVFTSRIIVSYIVYHPFTDPCHTASSKNYMALRTPTKGQPLITYHRNIRESQRVKGLRSKLSPKEKCKVCLLNYSLLR